MLLDVFNNLQNEDSMNSKTHVVIIGGGAIGLCTAYYLSKKGASVTVVDKGEMGQACSLHNAGFMAASHFLPLASPGLFTQALKWMVNSKSPLYIKPTLDPAFITWAWRFSRACSEANVRRAVPVLRELLAESLHLFEELSTVDGIKFDFTKRGLLLLYRTEKGKLACDHEARVADSIRVEVQRCDHDKLRELEPQIDFRATGGIYFPGDAHLVPAAFVKTLSEHVERAGVRLMSNCEVTGIETEGNKIRQLRTARGPLSADEFILASGSWSSGLARKLGIRMHLQPGKGYSITTMKPRVNPTIPYILTERRVAVTPFRDSLRFAGTMEFAGINLEMNRSRVDAILEAVPLYLGNVEIPDPSKSQLWCGLRPVTPDGVPYLGRLRKFPNLIVATGHAMIGISLATVTGKLAAEIATGVQPSHEISLLDPNRYE